MEPEEVYGYDLDATDELRPDSLPGPEDNDYAREVQGGDDGE